MNVHLDTALSHLNAQQALLSSQLRVLHVPKNLLDESRLIRSGLNLISVDAIFWDRRHAISYGEIETILSRITNEQSTAFVDLMRRYGNSFPSRVSEDIWNTVREGKTRALRQIKERKALPLSAPGSLATAIKRTSGEVNSTLQSSISDRGHKNSKLSRQLLSLGLLVASLDDEQDEIGFKICLGVAMGIAI